MNRREFLAGCAAGAYAIGLGPAAWAQTWPARPIKIIQGFAPGGNADTIARLVGNEIAHGLGQPCVVEAQTGAGGTIGSAAVARANPDGYTLLLATGGHSVAGAMYNRLPYETVDSFDMISTITFFPFLIVVRADSKYGSFSDLLKAAQSAPGSIAYGTAGIGSTHHLAGELLSRMAGVSLLHVPYRGDAASTTALLGGEVPFTIAPPTAVVSSIKAGKLRAIAVTGDSRWSGLPDVPTVAEQGVPGYAVSSWAGLMAPAGTPRPIIDILNAQIRKAIEVPAVRERLAAMGGEAKASTPEEMKAMVASELKRWTQVVADANIPKN